MSCLRSSRTKKKQRVASKRYKEVLLERKYNSMREERDINNTLQCISLG